MDLHGQHAHQSLLYPENHLRLLDALGGDELLRTKAEYLKSYDAWQKLKRRLAQIINLKEERQKKELLEYQLAELEKADLKAGERNPRSGKKQIEKRRCPHNLSYQSSQLLSNSGYDIDAFEILNPLRV